MKNRLAMAIVMAAGLASATADDSADRKSAAKPLAANGAPTQCAVVRRGTDLRLQSPAFIFALDTADGLRGRAWKNQRTGRQISLGSGPEVELDFDAAEQRLWITGWKPEGARRITHVFLPPAAKGKKLTLTLGGFGMYDYRRISVRINGQEAGVRQAFKRWNEPGEFDLGPESKVYPYLRFGQDNILEIQCENPHVRTARMEQLKEQLGLPGETVWPAQFEQYLTVGAALSTPPMRVTAVDDQSTPDRGEVRVELHDAEADITVGVTYRWSASEPVLHKFIQIRHSGRRRIRLMNVRLGNYPTDATVSEGEQGSPVYLADEFFLSVAHPAGWAIGQDKRVILRQYPGTWLAPGAPFECMEVVLGAAQTGEARRAFVDHVRSRCRRVARGHDRPYAIYDTFGANAVEGKRVEEWYLDGNYVLEMLDKLGQGKAEAGYEFDLCNTHFWVDYNGDLERFDPQRFPHGFTDIKTKLDKLGIAPGLWIDSCWAPWSIGGNPVVHSTFTHDPAYEEALYGMKTLCRATDPIRTMYSTAFAHHIQQNGIRLIKCDHLHAICYNPNHPHLPGVYSTEAIDSAVIETLHNWDALSPELFIMLYWGYRSPWWLLHADTLFESGLAMEAASPGPLPTLYVRDGVTVRLDQAQLWREDVPPLGKDSLGIWLSDWTWNSRIGKERWQEGFVMDLCRGSMLAQIWTDYDWLTPPERKQLAEFIALLKACPQCFGNPRFILGDPLKHEPYGYSCADGARAFLALNNCTWSDVLLPLDLNSKWGLPDHAAWDIYRWYPSPAKLQGDANRFGQAAAIALRPFQCVLLEIVPAGELPALVRPFPVQPLPARFAEASRSIDLRVADAHGEPESVAASPWTILESLSATSSAGAILTKQADHSLLASGKNATPETYTVIANTDLTGITAVRLELLTDPSLPEGGPGRAHNGNFVLSELRVTAAPPSNPTQTTPVALQNPVADFWQRDWGGWPVAASIDGDPKTGWQIDPQEGWPHGAIFEIQQPIGFSQGTRLTFVLEQTTPKDHTLGRFRLAVTTSKPPLPLELRRKPQWRVSGQVPSCPAGGTLVVSVELRRGEQPFMFRNADALVGCRGILAGHEVPCEPVVRGPGYPASWQAWRIALKPSAAPQPLELQVAAKAPESVRLTFAGHYIPAALP